MDFDFFGFQPSAALAWRPVQSWRALVWAKAKSSSLSSQSYSCIRSSHIFLGCTSYGEMVSESHGAWLIDVKKSPD